MSATASRLLEAVTAALRACPCTGGNAERGLPATDMPAPYGRVRLGTLASTNGPELTSHEQRILIDAQKDFGVFTGRHYGQAHEVDGVTILHHEQAEVGQWARVRITGSKGYDLIAEPV